jgi:mono/diheme cytochrome c family protein
MRLTGVLVFGVLAAALVAACSDDETTPAGGTGAKGGTGGTSASGGTGGSTGGASGSAGASGGTAGSAGAAGAGGQTPVERGEYLVRHVAACGDCHTPRKADGSLDESMWLAGVPNMFDLDPNDPNVGAVSPKNLTPDTTDGIGSWTAAQIKDALLNGVDDEGKPLVPIMPYYVFHNMTSEDADAIVAYLQQIPAVANAIPENQTLPFPLTAPADPVPANAIPDSALAATDANYDSAQRGKYLAGNVGICMECHTERSAPGTAVPLDVAKLFQGGQPFTAAELGLPSPPFPTEIDSANLTPTAHGIQGWTAQNVADALKTGITLSGDGICPPMPVGPNGAFGGLTDQDALDIGNYLTTLPPVDNGTIPKCIPPAPPSDAGTDASDASTD